VSHIVRQWLAGTLTMPNIGYSEGPEVPELEIEPAGFS